MKNLALAVLMAMGGVGLAGCEREIAEIETPEGEVEINETPGGGVEVEGD